VVGEDHARERWHGVRLNQEPDKVDEDVEEEGLGDEGRVDDVQDAKNSADADHGYQREIGDVMQLDSLPIVRHGDEMRRKGLYE
jgi:hypothetical protein